MNEYTPSTEDVANAIGDWAYRIGHPESENRPEMLVDDGQTMLDRWLASERARIWDEGYERGFNRAAGPREGMPPVNPYRKGGDA